MPKRQLNVSGDYYSMSEVWFVDPEPCAHGKSDYCLTCEWDAYESDFMVVKDSSGFKYLVDPEVEGQYQDYLITGLLPIPEDDFWFEHDLRDYYAFDDYYNACRHGNHVDDPCVTCDMEAYDDYLDELLPAVTKPVDPFASHRKVHRKSKQRAAARRDQTIRRHLRDKHNAHLAVIRETRYIRENALVLAGVPRPSVAYSLKETKKLADKPWSARFRNDPRRLLRLQDKLRSA